MRNLRRSCAPAFLGIGLPDQGERHASWTARSGGPPPRRHLRHKLRSFLDLELPDWLPQFDPVTAPAVRNGESVSARDYLACLARLRTLARGGAPRCNRSDRVAHAVPDPANNVRGRRSRRSLAVQPPHRPNTVAVNYLGLCAITMPVGRHRASMPVGHQFIAPAGAEEKLLALALAAERVLGTAAAASGRRRCSVAEINRKDAPC
jgi:aspartyl-tRNA(Asn)/glutamyl-tRNA(Gln) amidotransferase subunit A